MPKHALSSAVGEFHRGFCSPCGWMLPRPAERVSAGQPPGPASEWDLERRTDDGVAAGPVGETAGGHQHLQGLW